MFLEMIHLGKQLFFNNILYLSKFNWCDSNGRNATLYENNIKTSTYLMEWDGPIKWAQSSQNFGNLRVFLYVTCWHFTNLKP